jgi:hypothetical protein
MTRTGERTTVTSEAVPGVALTTLSDQLTPSAVRPAAGRVKIWPEPGICAPPPATRTATSLLSTPNRSSHSSQSKS